MKRFGEFANSPHVTEDLERLFTLIVINCALRNGDAHLKNFGIVYDDVQGEARLAPVYDLVTTSVYLPKDTMALTLNGATRWPKAKDLRRLGETRIGASPTRVREIMERVAEAVLDTSKEMRAYIRGHRGFEPIGSGMLDQWEQGIATSLKVV
jgi:serine/threonine-protein kinase HipA